jgi:hypothetical protein
MDNLQVGKGGLPPPNSHERQAGVNHPSQPANIPDLQINSDLQILFSTRNRPKDLNV